MAKATAKRSVRCYLCGRGFEVSPRAMSTTCPGCHKAIKIEDLVIKSYIPVVDLQTCGQIRIAKRGRVAAQRIQCGAGIVCEGAMEGSIETEGDVRLGPKAYWKGKTLQSRSLEIAPGAKLVGVVSVPWSRLGPVTEQDQCTTAVVRKVTKKAAARKTTTKKTDTAARKTTTKKTATAAKKKTAKKTATAARKTTTKKTATAAKKKTARKTVTAARKTTTKKTVTAAKKKTAKKTATAAKKKTAKKKR
jgi:hypothetical protein